MALVQGWHRQRKQTHGILPAGSGTSIYSRAKCGELEMPGEEGQEQRGGDNSRLLLQLHQLQRTPAEALPFPGAVPPGVANASTVLQGNKSLRPELLLSHSLLYICPITVLGT